MIAEDPTAARQMQPALDEAVARGRCPTPAPVWSFRLADPPECVPRFAARVPDVEQRDDDLVLFDRFFHVVCALNPALVHGRLDQFDTNLALLERYPHVPIACLWRAGLEAVRTVVLGGNLDETALDALVRFGAAAPSYIRLTNARAAVSVGGRDQAAELIAELPGPGAGAIADAVMGAVLALHDDHVLDAGRLVTEAINLESGHVWTELRPDLLELAAVVASRCDDHERAVLLLAAGESARVETGVGFRFRDQQAWRSTTPSQPPTPSSPTSRSTTCARKARRCRPTKHSPTPAGAAASVAAHPLAGTP